jgi:hypothetical protein
MLNHLSRCDGPRTTTSRVKSFLSARLANEGTFAHSGDPRPRLAHLPMGAGVRSVLSRDRPDLDLTPSGARRRWSAGLFSRLVGGIAREFRAWRDARNLEPRERPQDSDVLPNPWQSY